MKWMIRPGLVMTLVSLCIPVTMAKPQSSSQKQETSVSGGVRWNSRMNAMTNAIAIIVPLLSGEKELQVGCYPYALTPADIAAKVGNPYFYISPRGRLSSSTEAVVSSATLSIKLSEGRPSECILSWHVISTDGKGRDYSQYLDVDKQVNSRRIDLRPGGEVDFSVKLEELELFSMDAQGGKVILGKVACDLTLNGSIVGRQAIKEAPLK